MPVSTHVCVCMHVYMCIMHVRVRVCTRMRLCVMCLCAHAYVRAHTHTQQGSTLAVLFSEIGSLTGIELSKQVRLARQPQGSMCSYLC